MIRIDLTVLVVIFAVLKLTGYIAWSWWWVFAPLWLPLAVILFVGVSVGLAMLVIFGILFCLDGIVN